MRWRHPLGSITWILVLNVDWLVRAPASAPISDSAFRTRGLLCGRRSAMSLYAAWCFIGFCFQPFCCVLHIVHFLWMSWICALHHCQNTPFSLKRQLESREESRITKKRIAPSAGTFLVFSWRQKKIASGTAKFWWLLSKYRIVMLMEARNAAKWRGCCK